MPGGLTTAELTMSSNLSRIKNMHFLARLGTLSRQRRTLLSQRRRRRPTPATTKPAWGLKVRAPRSEIKSGAVNLTRSIMRGCAGGRILRTSRKKSVLIATGCLLLNSLRAVPLTLWLAVGVAAELMKLRQPRNVWRSDQIMAR
ncbi:hypothetical protein EVAR_65285_1 [Eumeta japonica]|uniref:Uncharacterized protein n=1 Tax=Eumeta variegata TaxID=151549 RepID=A0A4C1ZPN6_EUMVA|nr:hypothetical protein EVAR_65285_1 [Eumeta japonica]